VSGKIHIPYSRVGGRTLLVTVIAEAGFLLLLWFLSPLSVLPTPQQVGSALGDQIFHQGLLAELIVSMVLTFQALAIASAIALFLAYSYVLPFMRPIANAVSGLRYLGIIGFGLVFMVLIQDSHMVKVAIIVFALVPYLTTSLVETVRTIDDDQLQHARTMRLGHWGVTWQAVIRGRLDQTIEAIRQNAAMGWMMVAVAESMNRSEGGIGVRLAESGRYISELPKVFALIMVIFLVGALLDATIRTIRDRVCPYATLRARSM
jgi:ABC-type nitrate/sulfonate/bicarbonate transport system permease component